MDNIELVNHPAHYQGNIECIDYLEDKLTYEQYVGFLRGTIMKYMDRMGRKGEAIVDVKKAQWYMARLIDLMEKHNG